MLDLGFPTPELDRVGPGTPWRRAAAALRDGALPGVLIAGTASGLAILWSGTLPASGTGPVLLAIILPALAGCGGLLALREREARREAGKLRSVLEERSRELEGSRRAIQDARESLLGAERLATIGRMSAEMAHQVMNPLSSISLNLEILEDEISRMSRSKAVPETMRKLFLSIHQEIESLRTLTEGYLGFAHLPPCRWDSCQINDVVREEMEFVRPGLEEGSIRVVQALEADLPRVRLDRRQFRFALMSLVTNAREAMPRGGRLRLRTRRSGGWVDLLVSDTGVGIPDGEMARIFEPFFTTKQGGSGLGLSLARRIVESHGGRIACESLRGVGTSFRISLPSDGTSAPEDHDGD